MMCRICGIRSVAPSSQKRSPHHHRCYKCSKPNKDWAAFAVAKVKRRRARMLARIAEELRLRRNEYQRNYCKRHPGRHAAAVKRWSEKHPDRLKECRRKTYKKHRTKTLAAQKTVEFKAKRRHKDRIARANKRPSYVSDVKKKRIRYHTDSEFRLRSAIRGRIWYLNNIDYVKWFSQNTKDKQFIEDRQRGHGFLNDPPLPSASLR